MYVKYFEFQYLGLGGKQKTFTGKSAETKLCSADICRCVYWDNEYGKIELFHRKCWPRCAHLGDLENFFIMIDW